MEQTKFIMGDKDIPTHWYNIQADLPRPLPPYLHPARLDPMTPDDLIPIFPMELIMQEVSQERWIEIPEPVRDVYKLWRPTPLYRAYRWEKALGTPARIYYKWEGVSPPGSHKPNTAVAQAYYNKMEGQTRISTETGAGQWGSALSFGCNLFDLECHVYMVGISYDQKPGRKSMIEAWGGTIVRSPSPDTSYGRKLLEENPNHTGSLGVAISEAVEDAVTHEGTKYALGSVLNHVLMHQTVIGQEMKKQFEMADDYPDMLIGCIGGGSSMGGFMLPWVTDKIKDGKDIQIICVEPMASPSVTKGLYKFDFGDAAATGPVAKMYTLGHSFIPAPIHAGGLRYHGMAPIICLLNDLGIAETRALHQIPVFKAAASFARAEGIIPAPEPAHAVKVTMDEALKCKETGEEKVLAFNLCGHGHFDMLAFDNYFAGELVDYEYPAEKVAEAQKELPEVAPEFQ
jgi:tryptophan synthase beta chain